MDLIHIKEKRLVLTREKLAQFLDISRSAAYKWSNEGRPFIAFCDRYLEDSDVDEFLNLGKIEKFENVMQDKNLDDVFEFFGLLFQYDAIRDSFAKFCRFMKESSGFFGGEFSASSFLFMLPKFLEEIKIKESASGTIIYAQHELKLFKRTKMICEKYHTTFSKIEKSLKYDFLNIVDFFEKNKNDENAKFYRQERNLSESEFKSFIFTYFLLDFDDPKNFRKKITSFYPSLENK